MKFWALAALVLIALILGGEVSPRASRSSMVGQWNFSYWLFEGILPKLFTSFNRIFLGQTTSCCDRKAHECRSKSLGCVCLALTLFSWIYRVSRQATPVDLLDFFRIEREFSPLSLGSSLGNLRLARWGSLRGFGACLCSLWFGSALSWRAHKSAHTQSSLGARGRRRRVSGTLTTPWLSLH